jgi:hypothetical protein
MVNDPLIPKRPRATPEMQESPYFPALAASDDANAARRRKGILSEMPQI